MLVRRTGARRKLARALARTLVHMARVPRTYTSRAICERARLWAADLLEALEVEVEIVGEPPPWGCLQVANHASYLDVLVLMRVAPAHFLAKASVEAMPVIGRAARMAGTLFVEREAGASRSAARGALRGALQGGSSVTVFPEGTTSRPPTMHAWRPGSFAAAAEAGAEVAPIALIYADPTCAWVDDEPIYANARRVLRAPVRVEARFGPRYAASEGYERARGWIEGELARADGSGIVS